MCHELFLGEKTCSSLVLQLARFTTKGAVAPSSAVGVERVGILPGLNTKFSQPVLREKLQPAEASLCQE
jgi:hypothetical protein